MPQGRDDVPAGVPAPTDGELASAIRSTLDKLNPLLSRAKDQHIEVAIQEFRRAGNDAIQLKARITKVQSL